MPARCLDDLERFLSKTERDRRTGCLNWTAARTHGYGVFSVQDRTIRAHRWSLEQKLGRPLAAGMLACHTCDNRACVEPTHLYEGTHGENHRDAVERDRVAWGERISTHKLTEEQVHLIPGLCARGLTQARVAAVLDVSQSTISRIMTGHRWTRLGVTSSAGA